MSPPHPNAATLDPTDISPEEVQAELQSVLQSSTFARSEKLQKFLRYICEMTLRGESSRINEYLIGAEVFLRGPDYSPSEDSVVRRQAHALRQKLQEHYAGEGDGHALRIELPVGRYVPSFRRIREELPVTAVAEPVTLSPPEVKVAPSRWPRWALAIATAFTLLSGSYYWGTTKSPVRDGNSMGSATKEIWQPWIQPNRPAVICFSSPMTAVIKHFSQALPADSVPKRFRVRPEEEAIFRESFRIAPGGAIYFTPAVNQTKVGEAVAGVTLSTLLTRLQIPVQTTQSRFVNWDDLRGDDLILLGNNEANPWLDPLLTKAPLQLTPSEGKRQRAIVNTHPRPGEPAEYTIDYGSGRHEADQEYALVSMLPGLAQHQRLLLISGLNAQATQAAAEYLTTEGTLLELLGKLRQAAPQHTGAWNFQAVLKTEVHDKVPTRTWLVIVRVL